jgi:hypothetical protein
MEAVKKLPAKKRSSCLPSPRSPKAPMDGGGGAGEGIGHGSSGEQELVLRQSGLGVGGIPYTFREMQIEKLFVGRPS